MSLDKNKLNMVKEYFANKPVLKAYLFGSYVRDEQDEQSDIDILVDLDHAQHIGLQFFQMKMDLEALLNHKIDLISSNGISPYILPSVDQEKLLIYEK